MQTVLMIAFIVMMLLLPALMQWGAARNKVLNGIGPVVLCYAGGILLALLGLPGLEQAAKPVSEAVVPLAIPLMLMGRNLWVELRQTGRCLEAFGLACLSVCLASFAMGMLFVPMIPDGWKLAGMLAGVFTGSMPNFVSVGQALKVGSGEFVIYQAAEVMAGGVFLMILLSLAKPLLSRFLPPYQGETESADELELHQRLQWRDISLGLAASVLIAGSSIGASLLLLGSLSVPLVMFLLTLGGMLASAWPRLNRLMGTDHAGEYLIQVFCVAVGCQVQLSGLLEASGPVLLFTLLTLFSSVGLHLLLAKLRGHDPDTTIIASTAALYGPPFIAPVAEAIGNRALIGPGLTLGVFGYAIGTWLGLGVAYAIKALI